MNIEMISTGDEVICGYITDTNSSYISNKLLNIGLKMTRRSTVADDLNTLVAIFEERSKVADIIIVNGGLGPTTDDLSREAAAIVAKETLESRQELIDKINRMFLARGKKPAPNNMKQALLPKSAQIIPNDLGTAVGFSIKINRAIFIFTPGVPKEFTHMCDTQIIPFIQKNFPQETHSKVELFYTFGIGESSIGNILEQVNWPKNITIGYRVENPYLELKLCSSNAEDTDFHTAIKLLKESAKDYLIAEFKFDFYEQILAKINNLKFFIVDNATSGYIFNLLSSANNNLKLKGTINSDINIDKNPNDLILKLNFLNNAENNKIFEIEIIDHRATSNISPITFKRTLKVLYSMNRIKMIMAFTALDILRRYLTDKQPSVEYEFIKNV